MAWADLVVVMQALESPLVLLGLAITVYFSYRTSENEKRQLTVVALEDFNRDMTERYRLLREQFREDEWQARLPIEILTEKMKDPTAAMAIRNYLNRIRTLAF